MTFDLAVNLAAALICFFCGIGYSRFRRWREYQRPGTRVWRIDRGESVSIVTADGPDPDPTEYTITVYPSEYAAAMEIAHYLGGELGCTVERICTSSEFPMDRAIEGNLVLIGGPVHNQLTQRFLDRLSVPFHFEDYTLVDERTGQRFDATIEDGAITSDVALVVLAPNPFNRKNRVALIAGCRTYGCIAGARQLILPSVAKVAENVEESSFLVVRSEVVERYVGGGHLMAAGNLPEIA